MASPHDSREEETEQHAGVAVTTAARVAVFWEGGSTTKGLPLTGALTFGRALDCDVPIDHKSVSRRHAVLHVGEPLVLEDLGSANGTRVRGQTLGAGERVPVDAGDVIELGSTMVVVQRAGAPDSRASQGELQTRRVRALGATGPNAAVATVVISPAMKQLHRLAALVAATDVSVIVRGETGVGKDVVASVIHDASPRASAPLVCLNCAALPEALLESELFGHERGAFTGADRAKPGLFEAANGGTVFLDEVAEMTAATQAKLLRAVESRQITRVGSLKPTTVDVRIVAATHADLEALVRVGSFRQDLYFRLNGVTLTIPPLRERVDEIVPLAELFVSQAAAAARTSVPSLAPATKEALRRYEWPGNVRELKNAMGQAMIFRERSATIDVAHLPPGVVRRIDASSEPTRSTGTQSRGVVAPDETGLRGELDAFEKERIVAALEQCSGNQTRAARLLGISRRTLISRLDAYGLPRPRK